MLRFRKASHFRHLGVGSAVIRQVILRHIGSVNDRLICQQIILAQQRKLILVRDLHCLGRLPGFQMDFDLLQQSKLLRACLVHSGCLCHLGYPSLQYLQIGEDQLQVNGLYITERIHAAVHMYYIRVFKASHHMDDGIHFPDIAQELIPQPFPF